MDHFKKITLEFLVREDDADAVEEELKQAMDVIEMEHSIYDEDLLVRDYNGQPIDLDDDDQEQDDEEEEED